MQKYVVQVVRSVGTAERVLAYVPIEEMNPRRAHTKAHLLLAPWRSRGATKTRLLKVSRRS